MIVSPTATAFRIVPHLSVGLVLRVGDIAADVIWAWHGRSVHLRTSAEEVSLNGLTRRQISHRVTLRLIDELRALAAHGPVVLALTRSGDDNVAAAYAGALDVHIPAFVEELEPPQPFQAFVEFRQRLGMNVVAAQTGWRFFPELLARARVSRALVQQLDRPLFAGALHDERASHAGDSGWTMVVDIAGPLAAPRPTAERTAVETHTQASIDAVAQLIRRHARDWHILQRLFVEDLDQDQERLSRPRERYRRGQTLASAQEAER